MLNGPARANQRRDNVALEYPRPRTLTARHMALGNIGDLEDHNLLERTDLQE